MSKYVKRNQEKSLSPQQLYFLPSLLFKLNPNGFGLFLQINPTFLKFFTRNFKIINVSKIGVNKLNKI